MKLYFAPGACSLAPHIVLEELGLPYEAVPVNLKTHQYAGGDFLKVNPKGSVPALELDGHQILTEAGVVLQYLADQKPEAGLIPRAGTLERYRCQEWLNFIATELHKGIGQLWHPGIPEAMQTVIRQNAGKKLDFVSTRLQKDSFLLGSQFTVADAYLFTILSWTEPLKIDLSQWHPLLGFAERVRSRPAVQKTLRAEGLLK